MNAFFFANNDQMSNETFAAYTKLFDQDYRDDVEFYAAGELIESEQFIGALADDIKAVFGNEVDLNAVVDCLFSAAADFIHPYKDTRMLIKKQSEIEMAALNLAMKHGIKSKPFANRAIAYQMYLRQELAA